MINKFIFTLISTLWIWVIYGIQKEWTLPYNNTIATIILMILIPMLLTLLWLLLAGICCPIDNIEGDCNDVEEAHNDFLSDYLGYFFISIGIDDNKILLIIYFIIFIFTFVSQRKLFNPILLILGYKYYNIVTSNGTKIFLISRKSLRHTNEVCFDNLRRINDMSYIDFKG